DGRSVATAGEDGDTRIYDTASRRQVAVLAAGDMAVDSAAFSPDGRRIVTAGLTADWTGVARIWDVAAPHKGRVFARGTEEIQTAAFSQDGREIVTSTPDTAVIWDTRSGQRRVTIKLPKSVIQGNPFAKILGARLSPDGKWVLTFDYNAT